MMPGKSQMPALRFAGFTGEWVERKFSQIARLLRGLTYSPSDVQKAGVRVLRSSNICNDSFVLGDDDVFVRESAVNIEKVEDGNILITAANGSSRLVGKHAIVKGVDNFVHGGFMLLAKADNPYFLHASMSSSWYRSFINIFVSGGNGAIGNLRLTDLDCQAVPVPPKTEEKAAIGNLFRIVDALISQQQKKVEKLQGIKKGLMKKMFPRGGCTLPEVRFAGFDEEWEKRKLGAIGKTYSGLSGKTKDDIGHGEGFFVTYMNVYSNPIATESMTERVELDSSQTEVSYGDVFFTISSETPEEVAMASVWLFETSDTYLNSFCFGFRPQQDLLDPYFFAYELRAPLFRGAVTFLAQGISRYNISKNRVMDIYVFFPGKSEQTAIGRLFRKLDDLITLHGQKLEKLRHVKQALLGKMFV